MITDLEVFCHMENNRKLAVIMSLMLVACAFFFKEFIISTKNILMFDKF